MWKNREANMKNIFKHNGTNNWLSAFTLAEVIITLAIIGVVAAMTIPNLIKNYQKQQSVTGLQKALSVFNSTFKMAEIDNGPSSSWGVATEWDLAESTKFWNTYLVPYLNVQKTCTTVNSDNTSSNCWASSTALDGANVFILTWNYTLLLGDGMTIHFAGVCNTYGVMYVDINGFKKPNVIGKDIFEVDFFYTAGRVKLGGQGLDRSTLLNNDDYRCNKQPGLSKGSDCGALIQLDGWKISDDYPWN